MNKKGVAEVPNQIGFYLILLILLSMAIVYGLKLVSADDDLERSGLKKIEDSVMINRVVSCLSGNDFGEINKNKFNEVELNKCLGNSDYDFLVSLEGVSLPVGEVGIGSRDVERLVLIDGELVRLGVSYSKNVF